MIIKTLDHRVWIGICSTQRMCVVVCPSTILFELEFAPRNVCACSLSVCVRLSVWLEFALHNLCAWWSVRLPSCLNWNLLYTTYVRVVCPSVCVCRCVCLIHTSSARTRDFRWCNCTPPMASPASRIHLVYAGCCPTCLVGPLRLCG
jgi:hypothetical protein